MGIHWQSFGMPDCNVTRNSRSLDPHLLGRGVRQQTSGRTIPGDLSHMHRMQLSTGQIVSSTWHGAQVQGATRLASARGAGWILIGASEADRNGTKRLVYFDKSSGELAVSFYGGAGGRTFLGSTSLA